ncbi:MAG: hypothetical protein HY829_10785 [Actinobacteria bacterium]|nr:hypothetical protein [Actinomycetota bacterium]
MASNEEILAGMANILNEVADGPSTEDEPAQFPADDGLSMTEVAMPADDGDASAGKSDAR